MRILFFIIFGALMSTNAALANEDYETLCRELSSTGTAMAGKIIRTYRIACLEPDGQWREREERVIRRAELKSAYGEDALVRPRNHYYPLDNRHAYPERHITIHIKHATKSR